VIGGSVIHGSWITPKTVKTPENRRRIEETGREGDPFASFLEIVLGLILPRERFWNRDENIVDIYGKVEVTKRIRIYSLGSKDIVAIVAILMVNDPKCPIRRNVPRSDRSPKRQIMSESESAMETMNAREKAEISLFSFFLLSRCTFGLRRCRQRFGAILQMSNPSVQALCYMPDRNDDMFCLPPLKYLGVGP
jgi:hypothetical protein